MAITVKISNDKLPKVATSFEAKVAEVTQLAIYQVVALADPITPVLTGDLRNKKIIGPDFVHWTMPYAAFQDKGTIHIAPKLFGTGSAERVRPEWIKALMQIESWL